LQKETAHARRIVIAEENLGGQYRSVIQHLFEGKEIVGVTGIGSMITPGEILDAIVGRGNIPDGTLQSPFLYRMRTRTRPAEAQ
jgi:hypothetical protein